MPEIFGKNVKPQTVAIGVGSAGLLGIMLVRYRKQEAAQQAQAASQAAANAAAQAPGTGTGTSDQIDPATGFPYGSAEDASALTSQAQYMMPNDGVSYGGSGGYGGYNYYPTTSPAQFTSNAQWAQAAEQYMVGNGGDANAIGNALGKYITGQPLGGDDTSQQLIDQAIAFEGYPPVSGPNGFPPSVNTANPGSTGSTGTTVPSGNVTVPNVVGMTLANAVQAIDAVGLHHNGAYSEPSSYNNTVTAQSPTGGTSVATGSMVTITAPGASGGTTTYTVKAGDSLSSIAARYGTTWQTLYARNKGIIGSNPNLIKTGQVLSV